jgi:hypothetical protein
MRANPAMSLADSIRQTASMARCVSASVTKKGERRSPDVRELVDTPNLDIDRLAFAEGQIDRAA